MRVRTIPELITSEKFAAFVKKFFPAGFPESRKEELAEDIIKTAIKRGQVH